MFQKLLNVDEFFRQAVIWHEFDIFIDMKKIMTSLFLLLFSSAIPAEDDLSWASGSWFNPNRNYEGFIVQVLPGNAAVVTWFTYTP